MWKNKHRLLFWLRAPETTLVLSKLFLCKTNSPSDDTSESFSLTFPFNLIGLYPTICCHGYTPIRSQVKTLPSPKETFTDSSWRLSSLRTSVLKIDQYLTRILDRYEVYCTQGLQTAWLVWSEMFALFLVHVLCLCVCVILVGAISLHLRLLSSSTEGLRVWCNTLQRPNYVDRYPFLHLTPSLYLPHPSISLSPRLPISSSLSWYPPLFPSHPLSFHKQAGGRERKKTRQEMAGKRGCFAKN